MGIQKILMGDASFAGPANTTFIKDIASLWTVCIALISIFFLKVVSDRIKSVLNT